MTDTPSAPRTTGLLLVLLLAIAAVLRMARLDTLPPALFRDEAEKVYNAWSLLTTARDTHGKFLPLFIEVFGVTTSALYQYAAVPFVALFGLNEWGARMPAACVGTATVFVTFMAVRRLYDVHVALYAALFLALSPWHIVFSRWAQQGIFLPLLLSATMLGWSFAIDGRSRDWFRVTALCLAAACLALAMYAYDIARAFVPLLVLAHGLAHWRFVRDHARWVLTAAAVLLLVLSPVLWLMFLHTDAAQARFRFVSIMQPGAGIVEMAFHFAQNYAAHFSPAFLLMQGDPELRHGAGVGVLTVWEAVMLLVGIGVMAWRRGGSDLTWLAWLLLFPMAASLTRIGIPHALRSIVAMPAIQVIAGVGMAQAIEFIVRKRNLSRGSVRRLHAAAVLLAIVAFVPFARAYYSRNYQVRSAVNWQYGVKRALAFLEEPAFRDATVYLDTTTLYGAEYLVPVYAKLPAKAVQAGEYGRYRFIPPRQAFSPAGGPAVYVHVPLVPGPVGWRPIAYFPQDETSAGPALMLYLDPILQERIRQNEAGGQ